MEATLPDVAVSGQVSHNIALPWWRAGCSVVPIKPDGTKRPSQEWKPLQERRMTEAEVHAAWSGRSTVGVAVICGQVSGNLEMLELEAEASNGRALESISAALVEIGLTDLWSQLNAGYSEWTPSGGLHLLYRISDHAVPGNTKIASGPTGKTLSETRGEGGYVIVAPSPGECHPSGEAWLTINGSPETIPTISWDQRERLHRAIWSALDQSPPAPPQPPTRLLELRGPRPDGTLTPGDDYALKTDWAEILEPHGWRAQVYQGAAGERLWTRPGKRRIDGSSASTDYQGKPGLYVWSTSTGLPSEQPLSKLFVYAHYNHGGDMQAAARSLREQGYGSPRPPALRSDTFMGDEPTTGAVEDMGVPSPVRRFRPATFTDVGMAEMFHKLTAYKFVYVPARNKWMYWNGSIWQLDYRGIRLREEIVRLTKEMLDEAKRAQDDVMIKWATKQLNSPRIEACLSVLTYTHYADADQFDADRNLLNVQNGMLDLKTFELHPHDSRRFQTKMMGAAFRPEAHAPRWEKYLSEVLPDPAMQDFLQRMVGYTMTGNPVQRALAILHGPGGTGKSRFIEILSRLFGSYGTTAADSLFRSKRDQPTGPSNDLNDLRGARLASVSELDYGLRMDEALVKRLTGLDRITSRGLYEENQTWMPQCVIWLATNHHFRITSDDGAIWSRIKVIPFTQKIEHENPHILEELIEEADGIFNWMVEGLRKYYEHGVFVPDGVREAIENYKGEQDMVTQFIIEGKDEERLILDDNGRLHTVQSYHMFKAWCQDNMLQPLGRTRFFRRMEAAGFSRAKASDGFWYWHGIQAGLRGVLGSL